MKHLQCIWARLEEGEPAIPRIVLPAPQPRSRRHAIPSTFALMCHEEQRRWQWTILHLPRQMPKTSNVPFYIVHLYSGRRRDGDFHSFMQGLIDTGPFEPDTIILLSIDTAISDRMNVHSPELWRFLEAITNAGQVLALLLGPPCETWSSARFETHFDEAGQPLRGPRPLRGDLDCWGLLGCSCRELAQLSVGNTLLLKGLQVCVPTAAHGGATALEHPTTGTTFDLAHRNP